MKIILYKDVPELGEEGDVKIVADGYARNYLIPKKFAVRYTKATETELAQKQKAISRRKEEKITLAAGDKTRIESLEMTISAPAGEKGRLFGSITSSAIADYLHSMDIAIERKRIELPEAGLKTLGTHTVHVKLYGGDRAALTVNVTAEGESVQEEPQEVVIVETEQPEVDGYVEETDTMETETPEVSEESAVVSEDNGAS